MEVFNFPRVDAGCALREERGGQGRELEGRDAEGEPRSTPILVLLFLLSLQSLPSFPSSFPRSAPMIVLHSLPSLQILSSLGPLLPSQ
jgi:hypothetical protein